MYQVTYDKTLQSILLYNISNRVPSAVLRLEQSANSVGSLVPKLVNLILHSIMHDLGPRRECACMLGQYAGFD
jgi:hypothetical protein